MYVSFYVREFKEIIDVCLALFGCKSWEMVSYLLFHMCGVFPRAGLCLRLGFRRETMAGGLDLEHHEHIIVVGVVFFHGRKPPTVKLKGLFGPKKK